jgi:hypothetical protein
MDRRDRDPNDDRDPFDERGESGSGWQEPAHLGEGAQPEQPRGWEPPGWSLPPAEGRTGEDVPGGPAERPVPAEQRPPAGPQAPPEQPGGLWGRGRRAPGEVEKVFQYEGDVVGAQHWALDHGWTVSDGTGPEDAALQQLITSAPVRLTKDHRPGSVLRGRAGTLELVAFDAVYASGRYLVPQYAITAAPLLVPVPDLRLSPARLWKHKIAGLLQIPTGDEAFDTRWMLLSAADDPAVRRLADSATVRGLLLGTDDGDEFWTSSASGDGRSGTVVAAIRPDGHRPLLIEHHTRLLTAIVAALSGHDQPS